MRPTFRPLLVNGPTGDPALLVRIRNTRRSLLVDLGDLARLSPRQLLTVSAVFVSHTHMDHFAGFDRLLRIAHGRSKTLLLFGPEGFIDRVGHKLGGYTWNLVGPDTNDFRLEVTEVRESGLGRRATFRVRTGFQREENEASGPSDGRLISEPGLEVLAAVLDHHTPCLAFAFAEPDHLNVWPDRLKERGLATGDWLATLKEAVREGRPDDYPIQVAWREGSGKPAALPLRELRESLLSRTRGQKIAYVVDARYSEANAHRIADLASGADRLYIEAAFAEADADRAATTNHLTARQAGQLARAAGIRELVPFHFSSRYQGRFELLEEEAFEAFRNG
ncbi:ribonuclease Z [Thiohalorhabdus sp.]|uniref:ribonuclease Z n=1 Tax=Thiohalorhabdus sp. TaxID=3094134 RepID=UPI002FC39E45